MVPSNCSKTESLLDGATILFDIGGTWTRAAHWPLSDSAVIAKIRTPSRTNGTATSGADLITQLVDLVSGLVPASGSCRAVVSLGAALDHRHGVVYGSAPLWGAWSEDVPFSARLHARRPQVQWVVVNDVSAMLAAYRARHPELAAANIVVVTISSGIAARSGDPISGAMPIDPAGLQGEIGHLPAVTNDVHLTCACGQRDHVAAFSSGPGLRAVALDIASNPTSRFPTNRIVKLKAEYFESSFAAALEAGDPFAHQVLDTAVGPIADVFTYMLTTQPDIKRIVMTGGVIDSIGLHYREAVLQRMYNHGVYQTSHRYPDWLDSVLVLADCPEETSPLLGASLLADPMSIKGIS